MHLIRDFIESLRNQQKRVFFRSIPLNRKLIFWYAQHIVKQNSRVEPLEGLQEIDRIRKSGNPLVFICNHLTYADSHLIETLLMRFEFTDLAEHLIHVAGQKTYDISRRWFTRSLNTIRVYQPKAGKSKKFKRKMNSRALQWAAHMMRKGYSLLVFPEGTRTRHHKRFNRNSANPRITIYFRNSQVVPIALMGAEKIMPIGKVLQRPGSILLRIGRPFIHSELESDYRARHPQRSDAEVNHALMQLYMQEIDRLLDPEYQHSTD